MKTTETMTLLRSLDPAVAPDPQLSPRACADLESILAAERHIAPARPRRPVRRIALGIGAVAAAGATVLVLPTIVGGDQAFASWTGVPDELTTGQQKEAATKCREAQQDGAGSDYAAQLAGAPAAVAERRGDWTTVLLADEAGFAALCVTDDSRHLFADMFGSVGVSENYAPLDSRQVVATDLGVGAIDAGELSLAAGYVGVEVAAISYTSPVHGTVEATVSAGHFVLWLPGSDFQGASSSGVTVAVSYTDGTNGTARLSLS